MFETVLRDATGEDLPITAGSMPNWVNGVKMNNGFGSKKL